MIAPKKSLGQNFLKDENVARKIVEGLRLKSADVVVEIGPGRGALTKHLLQRSTTIIGIEVDARAIDLLDETFGKELRVIKDDVLNVRLAELSPAKKLRIIGNIPYYITSEILFWLFEQKESISDATLMMQLEVAQRLTASPRAKAFGILSIFTQLYTKPEVLFKVSRNCFYPKPNVDSAVVHLDFSTSLPPCNITLFKNIVRTTFGKRRKTLRNGLKDLGFSEEQLDGIRFDLKKRPEELTLQDFLLLTKLLEPFQETAVMKFQSTNPKPQINSKI
ncbi:MAG: ribosomal RNA small subunit methyltransferase A [Ignavibacteriales bacterium]|nr:ribosomal RNA small subunit methyltransferase A [Ignavibacteriales bacterium]